MSATTLRLPEKKLKLIRAIAGYENRPLSKIFEELADEYIDRHRETLELLRIPGFVEECQTRPSTFSIVLDKGIKIA